MTMKLLQWLKPEAEGNSSNLGLCISYPKSGRTWLRVMLDQLVVGLDYTHGGSAFHRKDFRSADAFLGKRPLIFLYRNPIDTTISGYFHVTKREAWRGLFQGDLSSYVRDPHFGIERTLRFNAMWLAAIRERDDVLITRYETLHSDALSELRRIAKWLKVEPDEEEITKAINAGRFETMRAKESSGQSDERYGHRLRTADSTDSDSFKVRRGVVGGYKDYLAEKEILYCKDMMESYGLSA
ncbi:sulfotransferase domain-containing protein [Mesorhizobium sp.]|nr:sulfotransferase domain-containing protein [Mesorhizobium sp.]TIP58449.1 MAG: sulfotransferase domain-containing protein [Mesorhizobium sp.]TIQ20618.1 MAG: sulfotransferase domain-containing protein [Mesorhizobium sp.]TIQ32331.1 MAG: sulfotransferase domain-containing protein [Mesorhizobium sp.]